MEATASVQTFRDPNQQCSLTGNPSVHSKIMLEQQFKDSLHLHKLKQKQNKKSRRSETPVSSAGSAQLRELFNWKPFCVLQNTDTQTQIHKYKYTNTKDSNANTQTQIHKHKYTNTYTQIQNLKYKYKNIDTKIYI